MPSKALVSGGDVSRPGRLLAHARRDAGLTQAELARRLGISQAAVAQLEQPDSQSAHRDLGPRAPRGRSGTDALGAAAPSDRRWTRA